MYFSKKISLIISFLFIVSAGSVTAEFTAGVIDKDAAVSDFKIGARDTDTSKLTPERQKARVIHAVSQILKVLSKQGKNASNQYTAKKYANGSTNVGYDVTIPGSDLGVSTLYSRAGNIEVWHVGISMDTSKTESSALTSAYSELNDVLGTPKFVSLALVVSEDSADIKIGDFSESLKVTLDPFKNAKTAPVNKRGKVSLAKGVNFFASIKPPEDGPFNVIHQAMLMGGTVNGGLLHISGSVGYDVLGKLMADGNAEEDGLEIDAEAKEAAEAARVTARSQNNIPAVALKITLPSVIPVPFSLMDDVATAKKSLYMVIDKTVMSLKYDELDSKLNLEAQQVVNMWVLGEPVITTRKIAFSLDETDTTNSTYILEAEGKAQFENLQLFEGFALKEVKLSGKTKVNIKTSQWKSAEPTDESIVESGIKMGAHRGTSWTSAQVSGDGNTSGSTIGANRSGSDSSTTTDDAVDPTVKKNKTTELSIALGVTVEAMDATELKGALGLTTIKESGGKVKIKEVFIQFDSAGNGLTLGDIDVLKDVPLINDFDLQGLGIGITPTGDKPGFYLYSGVKLTRGGFDGQFAVMVKDNDAHVIARIKNFDLNAIIDKDDKIGAGPIKDAIKAFKMPDAMLVLSTAAAAENNNGGLKLSELPTQIQLLFNGIVSDGGVVPIYGDGLTIIGAIDLSQDTTLGGAIGQLGIDISKPIIMAGSIGGVSTGSPSASFSLNIDGVKAIHKDDALSDVVKMEEGGGRFFINVTPSQSALKVGLSADFIMSLPRVGGATPKAGEPLDVDRVKMGGDIYLNIDATGLGLRFAGYTKGDWNSPLGLEGIILKETAVLIGADADAAIEIGFGTTMQFNLGGGNLDSEVNTDELESRMATPMSVS